jgi:hypothetical protein
LAVVCLLHKTTKEPETDQALEYHDALLHSAVKLR